MSDRLFGKAPTRPTGRSGAPAKRPLGQKARRLCALLAAGLCAALAGCGSQNAAPPQPPQYTCAAGDGLTGDFFDIAFQKPVVIAGRVWLVDYLTLYSCGLDGRDQTDWQAPNYSEQIV